ncbi:hypothetical protein [Lysobacter sp. TY2-98]|uniref:hypothetical protein n=1 Tax=Lysobacter sp. TY2-98 TaxID=2290922 RepID=UPI0013B3C62D|nr:hypothetical protein [Lysobacter sp. TY2-98]
MRILICLMALVVPGVVLADGVPLKNGRYAGKVLTFSLTPEQRAAADRFRTCHLAHFRETNIYTPYVFRLSKEQAEVVRRAVGFAPSRFDLYETYRGFNDSGPHWNLALRYSAERFEVPLELLLRDHAASAAEREQGWKNTNPCFPLSGPNNSSKPTPLRGAA